MWDWAPLFSQPFKEVWGGEKGLAATRLARRSGDTAFRNLPVTQNAGYFGLTARHFF
ncbi:hypothetical protein TPY_0237 [Sulfobacillus acidophilus TPY]|nr:hypothetical protein TPY_0237 [Sulfobacillus acidophilus TPY]